MSAILSLESLNDFISPGVACIKPVETLPTAPESNENEVSFNTDPRSSKPPPAEISLTDCLACSGCVTSAEAVLVSLQSHNEVLTEIDSSPALRLRARPGARMGIENPESGGRIYVASVSPQSRASIAATFGVTEREAGYMIEQLLSGPRGIKSRAVYRNGFQWVVDTNTTREACLVLGADEVIRSMGRGDGSKGSNGNTVPENEPSRPILASSCPGWICYAEKTHPHILPHLSRLKSPQALMGTLLKTTISRLLGISPDRIWHVAIMPCFDKKLEASREELTDASWKSGGVRGVRDVDCVITSKELLMLADSRKVDFAKLPRIPLPRLSFPDQKLDAFLFPAHRQKNSVPAAGTSGGNLHYILQCFASQHEGAVIQTSRGRNADVSEYTVTSATGDILFKGARYYGFRNIQNLVRKLKPARPSRMPGGKPSGSARKPGSKASGPEYVYVEVMACPGGCTNGGGQIKADDPIMLTRQTGDVKPGPQEQKEWLAQVDEAYFSSEDDSCETILKDRSDIVDGISPSQIRENLDHWAAITGLNFGNLVYTTYREVISDVGKNVDETQRVVEIAGKMGGGW